MENIDLKQIEKKVYGTFFEDGLFEMGLGCTFLFASFSLMVEKGYFLIPIFIVPILLLPQLKKRVVAPRIGMIRVSKKRKRNHIKTVLLLMASVLFNFILIVLIKNGKVPQVASDVPLMSILIAVKIFLVLTLIGYFLVYDRLHYWAFLLTSSFLITEIRIHQTGNTGKGAPYLMAAAAFILLFGVILFIRFLKTYPLEKEETSHAES